MDAERRLVLPISGGVPKTVHANARQLRLGEVMLKPDEKSPLSLNKARLGQSLV
jgi:hypothetical protein